MRNRWNYQNRGFLRFKHKTEDMQKLPCFGIGKKKKERKYGIEDCFSNHQLLKNPSWNIFSNKEGLPQSFWLLDINHKQSLPQFQVRVHVVDRTLASFSSPGHWLQTSSIDQNRKRVSLTNLSFFSFGLWLSSNIRNQVD